MDYREVLDKGIIVEEKASEIYRILKDRFPEDRDFWWRISLEEKNHASIITSIRDYFSNYEVVPPELISYDRDTINENLTLLERLIKEAEECTHREDAFKIGLEIESSILEVGYEKFIVNGGDSKMNSLIRQLNSDSINHYDRIEAYMKLHL